MAETTKSTRTRKTSTATKVEETKAPVVEEKSEKSYTEDDVKRLIAEAIANFKTSLPKEETKPKEESKTVTLIYLGAIAARTTVSLGKLGNINKAGVPRSFPKDLFFENLGRPVVDHLLSTRRLIVLDGLTPEERERYDLQYNENEVLSKNAFFKLLDYGQTEICDIFSRMCIEHKRLIAKIFYSAYFESHDKRINAETVKALNALSKEVDPNGMFTLILEDMGRKFAE